MTKSLAFAALFLATPAAALYDSAGSDEIALEEAVVAPQPAAVAASALRGIMLDPGHGGEDFGAVVAGRREKDLALAIAHKVKARLEALGGAPVTLTREDDRFIALNERVDRSLHWSEGAFVSLHLNQVRHKKLQGITIFAFGQKRFKTKPRRRRIRNLLPPLPAPPPAAAAASNELARALVRSLRSEGFRVDPPAKAAFYVLKNPRLPSVLVELGYLSNPEEREKLVDPAYQERLADALARSIKSYLAASAGVPAAAGR